MRDLDARGERAITDWSEVAAGSDVVDGRGNDRIDDRTID